MDLFELAERGMSMDEKSWMRHANPWSVWTRFTCLPLIIFAIWSRVWIGWWALLPLALALFWTWANPRAFPPPATTDSWPSKGTFGERIFLNRKSVPIPNHHRQWALILTGLSVLGLPPLVWGLWMFDLTMTLLGVVLIVLPKVWFCDRMVWLFEDMRKTHPDYDAWMR